MLDLIRYLPLAWRKRDVYCTPRGPNLARARRQIIVVGGSRVTVSVPRHSSMSSIYGQRRVCRGDALARGLSINYGNGFMANKHWGFRTLLSRTWAFWGPWMTGAKAQLVLRISLVGRHGEFKYGSEISFFHPRAFENALADYLNDRYGHQGWEIEKPCYVGPVNWQRQNHLPVFGARFDILERDVDSGNADSLDERFLVFPITPSHFLEIALERHVYQLKNWNEPSFDITPVDALEASILQSVHLELGPDTQAEWDKAKAEFGDISLSDEFPPLRWPTEAFVPTPMDPEDQALLDWLEREQ